MDTGAALDAVVAAIRAARFRYTGEEQLQEGLQEALRVAGIIAEREVRLPDGKGRIDLLTWGGGPDDDPTEPHPQIGIEVKVAGSLSDVGRQARRYLESEWVHALVLVTIRARHLPLHGTIDGKPLVVVSLAASGL